MTLLIDTMKKGYTEEETFAVLFESEKDKKRRQMLAIVTKTVDAPRLQKIKVLLTFEKLATWRRINSLDRAVDGEDNWSSWSSFAPIDASAIHFEVRVTKVEICNLDAC